MVICLWFDGQAEDAANFYTSLLPDSRVDRVTRAPGDYAAGKEGDVLTVEFTLAGRQYLGLNGGSQVTFNMGVSLQIMVDDQADLERLSDALSAEPDAEMCSWVRDRYGLSWQIVPRRMSELLADPDRAKAKRVFEAMQTMRRIDIAAIERAAAGAS